MQEGSVEFIGPRSKFPPVIRFGDYELDLNSVKLSGRGRKIRLGEKPFLALMCLLENAGEVITRKQLCHRLWPSGTFVEFDDNLNATIKRLREALSDSASQPSFIETIPRVGYRFVMPIQSCQISADSDQGQSAFLAEPARVSPRFAAVGRRFIIALASIITVFGIVALHSFHLSHRTAARGAIVKLGVVRFTNATGNPNQDFLADGLSQLVTARLKGLAPMQLIVLYDSHSRNAVGAAAGPTDELAQLGVAYLLEANLLQTNGEYQLVTTLTQAGAKHVWTATYRIPIQEIFVEDDIARRITDTLSVDIRPADRPNLSRANTTDTSAYDFYMRGMYALNVDRVSSLRESITWFEQALQRDPQYAPPYAGLAQAYLRLGELRALSPQEAEENARRQIARGINLDHSLPAFYFLQASMLGSRPGNDAQSEQLYRRALQLAPQDAESHAQYALFLRERRPTDALQEINIARQLEPRSEWVNAYVGWVLISADRLDDAERQLVTALQLNPAFPATMRFLGLLEEKRGRNDLSTFWFEKAASTSGRRPYYVYRLAISYAKSGRVQEVQKLVDELRSRAKREPVDPRYIQVLDAALGG